MRVVPVGARGVVGWHHHGERVRCARRPVLEYVVAAWLRANMHSVHVKVRRVDVAEAGDLMRVHRGVDVGVAARLLSRPRLVAVRVRVCQLVYDGDGQVVAGLHQDRGPRDRGCLPGKRIGTRVPGRDLGGGIADLDGRQLQGDRAVGRPDDHRVLQRLVLWQERALLGPSAIRIRRTPIRHPAAHATAPTAAAHRTAPPPSPEAAATRTLGVGDDLLRACHVTKLQGGRHVEEVLRHRGSLIARRRRARSCTLRAREAELSQEGACGKLRPHGT